MAEIQPLSGTPPKEGRGGGEQYPGFPLQSLPRASLPISASHWELIRAPGTLICRTHPPAQSREE